MTAADAAAGGDRTSGPRGGGSVRWAGLALGFGLGGFFDGILLHQVLQWHHLLSGIEPARRDLRVLIFADGLFHLLMYVIAGLGLWLLWRGRRDFAVPGGDRRLLAAALLGFGGWHVLDGILSHWVLGIHRIRMDVDNPLLWDLLWLGVFGLGPILAAFLLRRGSGPAGGAGSSALLAIVVIAAGSIAVLPPRNSGEVTVLFRPDISPQQALGAIMATGGRLLGTDPSGQMWSVQMAPGGNPMTLYRHGAMLVSSAALPLGCFNWTKA